MKMVKMIDDHGTAKSSIHVGLWFSIAHLILDDIWMINGMTKMCHFSSRWDDLPRYCNTAVEIARMRFYFSDSVGLEMKFWDWILVQIS